MGALVADAQHAFAAALVDLQHKHAKTQQPSPALMDARDLAPRVRELAEMAGAEILPNPETWARIGALAFAGWMSSERSETLRIDTGDAA